MKTGKKLRLLSSLCLVLLLSLLSFTTACTKPAPAPASVSFAGKTITVIVSYTAGGTTDIMARVYAKYLPKYLPGNPTVVVRNMPGASGTIGSNHFYSTKPDGLTLLLGGGTPLLLDLLKSELLKFSFSELTPLVAFPSSSLVYITSGIINKPEDIVKAKGLVYGSTAGTGALVLALPKELIGFPTDKVVLAYPGSGDARRAFLAGETNFTSDPVVPYSEFTKARVEKGEVMPIYQTGMLSLTDEKVVKHPVFPPNVMTVEELYEKIHGKAPSGMAYDTYRSVIPILDTFRGMLLLNKGTPDSIIRVYRDATDKMIKDPEFIRTSEALIGKGTEFLAGEALDKAYRKELRLKPEQVEWLRNLMQTKYNVVL